MILKHQAVSSVQAVPSPASLTAFGSSTYSKASHVRVHKAPWVPGSWAVEERNKPAQRESKLPFNPQSFPFWYEMHYEEWMNCYRSKLTVYIKHNWRKHLWLKVQI